MRERTEERKEQDREYHRTQYYLKKGISPPPPIRPKLSPEERKKRNNEYDKQYRLKNKEVLKEKRSKKMTDEMKLKKNEYDKQYRLRKKGENE